MMRKWRRVVAVQFQRNGAKEVIGHLTMVMADRSLRWSWEIFRGTFFYKHAAPAALVGMA
jgi:hypothetical protein